MKQIKLVIAAILTICFSASFAAAAGGVRLEMQASEEIDVINEDGEREIKYIEASSIVPGDVVLYTIHYHNSGIEPAEAVVINNHIPEHMQFIGEGREDSAADVSFSIDNGNTFDKPENLFIQIKNGGERPATSSDYTHVRWHLKTSVSPGGRGTVAYRARLE